MSKNIFDHDYCDETKKTMREKTPVEFLMYLGEHRKKCGRCMTAIEKYKAALKEIYKQKYPEVLGIDD